MNGYELIRPFKSRKNKVWLIKDHASDSLQVLKTFCRPECCTREKEILAHLQQHGINVPVILAADNHSIRMTFIDARTGCEYFEQTEMAGQSVPDELIMTIWEHLARIYAVPLFHDNRYALNDVNLRNILISDQQNLTQIWQVDFEDAGTGSATTDIAGMLAFFLTYTPALTIWKLQTGRRMRQLACARFNVSEKEINSSVEKWLGRLGNRREQDYLEDFIF